MSKASKDWIRLKKKNKEDFNTCNFDEPAYDKRNKNKSAYKDVLQGRQKSNWRSVEFFETSQNQIP